VSEQSALIKSAAAPRVAPRSAIGREQMLTAPILPLLLRLTAPTTVAMLATALAAIAETAYVGLLGVEPLAAMALAFPMVMLMQMMSAGAMGGGVSSAISRALGADDAGRAHALALHAIAIALGLSLVFTVFFLLLGPAIYRLLGGRAGALDQAVLYSNTVFGGAAAIWLFNTLASVLRGTGNMMVPSVTGISVAALQIVIGGVLALGFGRCRASASSASRWGRWSPSVWARRICGGSCNRAGRGSGCGCSRSAAGATCSSTS
jgi:Na+-driven multidrug efflux pump